MAKVLQNSRHVAKVLRSQETVINLQQTRTKVIRFRKGLEPHLAKSWNEHRKLLVEKYGQNTDPKVNIGLPEAPVQIVNRDEFRKLRKEKDLVELERKARHREIHVPVDEYTVESFRRDKQRIVKTIADHYGIFTDLYKGAFFYPDKPLDILYQVEDGSEMVNPVFYGNTLTPDEVKATPKVLYPAEEGKLYTLCMTAPDSHLQDNNKEYLHWLVGNIPGSNIESGELLCDYLRPFPVKGTGLHRYVFILYQQDKTIDFSGDKRSDNCTSLRERSFETFEFLKKHQDNMTPVGLSFFQAEHDDTVRSTFHEILDMDEPGFEFHPPQPYIPKQKLWPIRESFNIYLDRYRDVKDINEEVLLEKLKMADPFKPRDPPKKYPNIYRIPENVPSWLKQRLVEKRLRKSYWKDLDD